MRDIVLGPPAAQARAAVVFMHGRDQSPAMLRAPIRRLALEGVRCVAPEADGNAWYPHSFLAPLAENEPALSRAIARYEGIVAELQAQGLPARRIVPAGFSQGACLTAEFLIRHPRRYGGAIVWTGGLIGPPGSIWPTPAALDGLPVLLTGSDADPFVPERRSRETAACLVGSGARVDLRIVARRRHEISDLELAAGVALVEFVANG